MLEKQERAANGDIDEEDVPTPAAAAAATASADAPAGPAAGKTEVRFVVLKIVHVSVVVGR